MITPASNQHLFAAYLNMARHNVFHVMGAICSRLGKEPITNDDEIFTNKVFDQLQEEENAQAHKRDEALRIIQYLRRYFPILEPMESEYFYQKGEGAQSRDFKLLPKEFREIFELLFKNLKNLRNEYTHAESSSDGFDERLIGYMNQIFDASVRATKERRYVEVEHMQRMKMEGRGRNAKFVPDPNFKYKFEVKNGKLNDVGLAFFTCLFLERKYAYELLRQLPIFKDTSTKTQIALEVFCYYHIRIPNQRIESDSNKNTLFMDMINELSRSPRVLYDQLLKADRELFRVAPERTNVAGYDPELDTDILLLRHEDRFYYFSMRYLDEQEACSRIRFMFDLGNYHFNVYQKTVSGTKRNRRLTQKLTSFGRFQDFSIQKTREAYPDLVLDSKETGDDYDKPWIVETNPHYHFFEENIPVKILENTKANTNSGNVPYPDITKVKGSKNAPLKEPFRPDAYISKYEMMPFALYSCLARKTSHNPAELVLTQYIDKLKSFLEGVENGTVKPVSDELMPNFNSPYAPDGKNPNWSAIFESRKLALAQYLNENFNGIEIDHIPKELRSYLLGFQPRQHNKVAEKRLEEMIRQTESRIRRLRDDRDRSRRGNKVGHKDYRPIKAGVLASYIAKDLMFFQPVNPEGKGKATGLTYQVLQATLAFFGANRAELNALFKECNLLDSPNPHPFLGKTKYDQCQGIIQFYDEYLQKRREYLSACLKEKNYDNYFWTGKDRAKKQKNDNYISNLAKTYLEVPVNLPRGLFIKPLKKWMTENGSVKFKTLLQNEQLADKGVNGIFLLQEYFRLALSDEAQPFYDNWKRQYKIFNQYFARHNRPFQEVAEAGLNLADRTAKQAELKNWINSLPEIDGEGHYQRASKSNALEEMLLSEKQIRLQKAQDMALFLLAKDLMQSATDPLVMQDNLSTMKLKDIAPNSEKGVLSTPINFKLKQNYEEISNGRKTGRTVVKTIYQEGIKIKNYGDFRRFLKDRRLPNLMFYLQDDKIARSVLENEIEAYDRARVQIFKYILDFEQVLLATFPEAEHFKGDGTENSKHGLLLQFWATKYPVYEGLRNLMKNLRNAFCHNQFPEEQLFRKWVNNKPAPLSEHFLDFAAKTYGEITAALNQLKQQQ